MPFPSRKYFLKIYFFLEKKSTKSMKRTNTGLTHSSCPMYLDDKRRARIVTELEN